MRERVHRLPGRIVKIFYGLFEVLRGCQIMLKKALFDSPCIYIVLRMAGGDKCTEQIAHDGGSAVHAFRVPLDSEGKWVGGKLDGFDDAVGSPGGWNNSFAESINCLVMETVRVEGGTCDGGEDASLCDEHFVADLIPGSRNLHMIDRCMQGRVNVLKNCSSTGDI